MYGVGVGPGDDGPLKRFVSCHIVEPRAVTHERGAPSKQIRFSIHHRKISSSENGLMSGNAWNMELELIM